MRQSNPLVFRCGAIAIDALISAMSTRQYDLAVSRFGQPSNFVKDVIARSARELWTDVRNDAVTTSKQATVLDFHVSAMSTRKTIETGGDIDHTESGHQIWEFAFIGDDLEHSGQA